MIEKEKKMIARGNNRIVKTKHNIREGDKRMKQRIKWGKIERGMIEW